MEGAIAAPLHHEDRLTLRTTVPCWWSGRSTWTLTQEINKGLGGSPGGSVGENLPANAGDVGSIPDLGRLHMPQSNSTLLPQLLSLCSIRSEATAVRSPYSPQLEKNPHSNEDPATNKTI